MAEKIDFLNRNIFIENIAEIIKTTSFEEDNRAFAIDGKWGVGKTFIVDKIEDKFKTENDYLIFRYNAWNYNYYDEPLVAIITSIIDQLNDYSTSGFKGITKSALKGICGTLFEILKTLGKSTAILFGLDKIIDIGDEAKKCKDKIKEEEKEILIKTKEWLDRYFKGEEPSINELDLNPLGSNFRKSVWKILCEIPYGEVITYKDIAFTIAKQKDLKMMSSQAVGGAVSHNPISIIIPCHRVVGSNGSLTGYAGGIDKKVYLLKHEKVNMEKLFIPKKGTAL